MCLYYGQVNRRADMVDLTDATFRRIDEAINQDVEMQASCLFVLYIVTLMHRRYAVALGGGDTLSGCGHKYTCSPARHAAAICR